MDINLEKIEKFYSKMLNKGFTEQEANFFIYKKYGIDYLSIIKEVE